ncbi:hypothetical protein HHK36_000460 [Tetracentron sinense]|uniref:Uncharacterized protein n=1 Tax=Tetracentron sinense TaxID=13715 RepID=A0A834ZVX3_TETSI|nr:hypothetical protein HHK36_000460 [Tetracentron sinense]
MRSSNIDPFLMRSSEKMVENFVQTRARVLPWQQNRFQIYFNPFQVNGMDGFVRGSGGTGVFLPRFVTTTDDRKTKMLEKRSLSHIDGPVTVTVPFDDPFLL